MSYENINDIGRQVKCRKNHHCEWCAELIAKGHIAVTRVYKFDGDFMSAHMHPECFDAMKKSIRNNECGNENSFYPGEAKRGKTITESEI